MAGFMNGIKYFCYLFQHLLSVLMYRKILFFICLFYSLNSIAQNENWPNPEVGQLYEQAKEYQAKGAWKEAITQLQQAIQLAPDVALLRKDLSNCYNTVGNYAAAYSTIEPLAKSEQADEYTYYITGTALMGMGEKKKAKKTYEKGLKVFPYSGMLYHELGIYYQANKDPEYAITSWVSGIEGNPTYALNYYEAAKLYAQSNQPLWALLYAEQYIQLDRHSARSTEMRNVLFLTYTTLFNNMAAMASSTEKTPVVSPHKITFENAALEIFKQLTPVVADGITTDNLTMLRTRFVMEWMDRYMAKFPFTLFAWQDQLLRDGQFEAYNQWLLGKVESEALYNSWTTFNADAIPALDAWLQKNKYNPVATDFYNPKNVKELFSTKR